ncbi:MAG: hypothetical protein J6C13_04210 [Clostridia bacterium]|nr:hypothetical protein [Clostridia bacterium]
MSCCVRPAAHLSLSNLDAYAAKLISASVASESPHESAAVDLASYEYVAKNVDSVVFTYTAYSGYYISGMTIANTAVEIQKNIGSANSYITITGYCKYKCYRNDENQVFVVLSDVKVDLSIIGSALAEPVTVTNVGGVGTLTYETQYDAVTGDTIVTVTPASGYYVYSIALDSNTAQIIERWSDMIYQNCSAFYASYVTTEYTNVVQFDFHKVTGQVAVNITLVTTANRPALQQGGGTSISGVALQVNNLSNTTTLACVGEARITGYSTNEGLTTIHVSAIASKGYQFAGWSTSGDDDLSAYKDSADIPYDVLEGKILYANFTETNASINDQTSNI